MLVAELHDARKFRLTDAEPQPPKPGEIQVRVKTVGICGSDLHYYAEGGIGDSRVVYPVVLGHEPAGEVHRTGDGVTGWQAGDMALLEPAIYCYHCEYCLSGRHNVCSNMTFLSSPPAPGFFREFVNLPAHNVVPLPKELDLATGTLFEPLAVVLHSFEFAKPQIGETAVVFGAGPIGLLTVAALKIAGASRVWCSEPIAHRRELARLAGADAVLDPAQGDVVRQILSDTGGRGVDMVLDCASKDDTINQSLNVARSTGRVVITGIPSELQVKLNFHTLRRKELYFYSVRRSNHETPAAIQLLRDYPKRFAPLVTHQLPLHDVSRAFEMLERGEGGAGKVVMTL
jgi:L-iditol 2-dehydrogenase